MSYAAQSDLSPDYLSERDLVELTDDDNTGEPDDSIITDALTKASARIDSYCRMRYKTPLQPSNQIVDLCCSIASWVLFSRRRAGTKAGQTIKQRYDDAITFLKDVAAGTATLDQPAGAQPQCSSDGPEVSRRPTVFGEKNTEGIW